MEREDATTLLFSLLLTIAQFKQNVLWFYQSIKEREIMCTLKEIRKANRIKNSLLTKSSTTVVQLTPKQYATGRKEYEEFVKPVSQKFLARQIVKGNL